MSMCIIYLFIKKEKQFFFDKTHSVCVYERNIKLFKYSKKILIIITKKTTTTTHLK
jgi:hypothetical protein